jgi:hypothetical protein
MKKQPKSHCHFDVNITNMVTGEQRQLSQEELAERMRQILSIPPAERVKMSFRKKNEKR